MIRDIDVSEGLIGGGFPCTELWAGEEVVHGLGIGGCSSHHSRCAQPEVLRSVVAHLFPGICCDHCLAELWIGGEGDLTRSHQLGLDVVQPGSVHSQDVASLVCDLSMAVRVAMQPARMQHHIGVCGWLELGGRISLGTHHELSKGVATMSLVVALQQGKGFVLHLWTSVALDESALKLSRLILEDQGLHRSPCVVLAHFGNVPSPLSRLLIEICWHEHGDLIVVEANLHNLLQGRVEPHETTTFCNSFTIHLQLNLVEASITFCVYPLLEVDAIRPIHLGDHLLHCAAHLWLLVWVGQVGCALATTTVDGLDQALLVEIHFQDLVDKLLDTSLLGIGVREVHLGRILLRQHGEGRRGRTNGFADTFEANLLQSLRCLGLRPRPHQIQRLDPHGGFGGLGKGGPTGHEDHLSGRSMTGKFMVLGAHEIQSLFEMIQIAPRLGPHVERCIHPW
mmetsp:Transcript_25350/g.55352  ORF Transcript_25350/g.55352 Transcript_25350/m.55352 type:complete len:452 (+) Transcript_25350:1536-2891(+)